jgi:two-component system, chemotaxis family, sensor kinase CheA
MEIDLSQFHQIFFEESFEGLDAMEHELLHLEEGCDSESINTIFRGAHSIKGGSATFNFKEVADFTHVLETLLDQMRDGSRVVSNELVDLLLKSVDSLRGMLQRIQDDQQVGDTHLALIERFNNLLEGCATTNDSNEELSEQQFESLSDNQQQDHSSNNDALYGWLIEFIPQPHILEIGNEPIRMFRELSAHGKIKVQANFDKVVDFDDLNPEHCYLSWQIELATSVSKNKVAEAFEWVEQDCQLSITAIEREHDFSQQNEASLEHVPDILNQDDSRSNSLNLTDSQAVKSTEKAINQAASSIQKSTSIVTKAPAKVVEQNSENSTPSVTSSSAVSIRVGIDKVDTLIDLVGELVITQSMLSELGENFDMSKINQLAAGLSELEQNTRELQESVMKIRMLPIGFVFNRIPRMVRDLSTQLDKQIIVDIKGESTELDKTVMEQIGDPLIHLVRNAVDHGIESAEARLLANKPEVGTISLNAYHQGGNIVIEIIDDGGGIDPDIVYQKAIEKKLIDAKAELNREQILALIMQPGFSTAETVSDVSGRGVGMDVVKRNITNLGGSFDITSELGQGTQFTIRLPLTLAILDGQLIKVADQTYVLPLVTIIESISLKGTEISNIAGDMPVYKFLDEYIPIIDLRQEFAIESKHSPNSEGLIAIVEGENRKIALKIDKLLGQQQVVIKSLETHYMSLQGVSGSTILGDGRVSLILDVAGLARRVAERSPQLNKLSVKSVA